MGRASSSRLSLAVLVLSAVAGGPGVFGTNSPGAPDTGPFEFGAAIPVVGTIDARVPDAAAVDAPGPEAARPEAGPIVDATADVPVDAAMEAPVEATIDAPIDVPVATVDAAMDAT